MDWYYDKRELQSRTPTIADGRTWAEEEAFRREGAKFILDLGMRIGLIYSTVATGVVYFHRFYMFHSFEKFPKYLTACSCLFLAGKVEETPKKCRDLIKAAREMLKDADFYKSKASTISNEFGAAPEREIMTLERIILQTFKFDLQVVNPHEFLFNYAKASFNLDQAKLEELVQMSWTFVNDSLVTTLCLQWEPEVIAIAMIHLALKLKKLACHKRWYEAFVTEIPDGTLDDICHQLLDVYQSMGDGSHTGIPGM